MSEKLTIGVHNQQDGTFALSLQGILDTHPLQQVPGPLVYGQLAQGDLAKPQRRGDGGVGLGPPGRVRVDRLGGLTARFVVQLAPQPGRPEFGEIQGVKFHKVV